MTILLSRFPEPNQSGLQLRSLNAPHAGCGRHQICNCKKPPGAHKYCSQRHGCSRCKTGYGRGMPSVHNVFRASSCGVSDALGPNFHLKLLNACCRG